MKAAEARHRAKTWVAAHRDQWPGLQAAHLVGGLTTMPDDAPFPAYKDVDLHLIVDEDSALLTSGGPFMPIIETEYAGLRGRDQVPSGVCLGRGRAGESGDRLPCDRR